MPTNSEALRQRAKAYEALEFYKQALSDIQVRDRAEAGRRQGCWPVAVDPHPTHHGACWLTHRGLVHIVHECLYQSAC